YKLKKPVSFEFADFSDRTLRERACHREVELNRRLAPDVYLGVADVLGEDGRPCDHLVVMRRMPADLRLAQLVRDGRPVDGVLGDIARRIAAFHAGAATSEEIAAAGRRDAVRAVWEASFDELAPFTGPVLDAEACRRVEHLVRRYLAGRAPLFDHRIALGAVRDGHGDLLADVAFLAMDLERLGAPDAAARFLARYREFAGETYPPSLADHYIAARAHVRCKVACFRHAQGDAAAAGASRALLDLAARHLEAARVRLVL